jgi:hypothetical protein
MCQLLVGRRHGHNRRIHFKTRCVTLPLREKRTTVLDGFDEFLPYGEAGELRTMQAL